ncbi:nucleoside deaminase [Proteocatella sphenisci]|uniref:nucleoside deaminase n=1 Tax=Proteocatella sphenisci TaxID=181070 RepID=UPI0004B29F6F|nr:nucleoside deaminase [Proteocatella sphenisci]
MKKDIINKAIELARETMNKNLGGPFGAAVIDREGNLLSLASNTVLGDHDPTAHAEINAIREAAKIKGTHDLSGCIIYATGYPCPMCLSAIIWANIKEVVYGCRPEDADEIGFRDDFIYHFIKKDMSDETVLKFKEEGRQDCLLLFREYAEQERKIY